jgi:hypothetical protein
LNTRDLLKDLGVDDNIKIKLKEVGFEGMYWIHLAENL